MLLAIGTLLILDLKSLTIQGPFLGDDVFGLENLPYFLIECKAVTAESKCLTF